MMLLFNLCNRDELVSGERLYAGVAITLLRLVREVGKDVGNVNREEAPLLH